MSRRAQSKQPIRPIPGRYRPVVLVGEILVALFLIWLARPLWSIIILAVLLAYLVAMPIGWISRRFRVPRQVVTVIVYLLLLILLLGLPLLAVPFLIHQTQEALQGLPGFVENVQELYQQWVAAPPTIRLFNWQYDLEPAVRAFQENLATFGANLDFETLPPAQEWANAAQRIVRSAASFLGLATGLATNIVGRVAAWILSLLLTLVISFYVASEGRDLRTILISLVPPSERDEFTYLLQQTGNVWRAFFRGQLILSTAVGVTTFILLTIIGLPGAALLALLAGILEILPNLGPLLAMLPALIVALIQGSMYLTLPTWQIMLIVVGIYFFVQQIENNVFVPRIHGHSVDLPPLLILIAVLVGTLQGGILGALLAAPLLGTLRIWMEHLHRRLIATDREPSPVQAAAAEPTPSAVPKQEKGGEEPQQEPPQSVVSDKSSSRSLDAGT